MKSIIATSALLLAVIVCYASAQSHHVQWGNPGWNERPAFNTTVKKSSSVLQVVTLEVPFPPPVSVHHDKIDSIKVK